MGRRGRGKGRHLSNISCPSGTVVGGLGHSETALPSQVYPELALLISFLLLL